MCKVELVDQFVDHRPHPVAQVGTGQAGYHGDKNDLFLFVEITVCATRFNEFLEFRNIQAATRGKCLESMSFHFLPVGLVCHCSYPLCIQKPVTCISYNRFSSEDSRFG